MAHVATTCRRRCNADSTSAVCTRCPCRSTAAVKRDATPSAPATITRTSNAPASIAARNGVGAWSGLTSHGEHGRNPGHCKSLCQRTSDSAHRWPWRTAYRRPFDRCQRSATRSSRARHTGTYRIPGGGWLTTPGERSDLREIVAIRHLGMVQRQLRLDESRQVVQGRSNPCGGRRTPGSAARPPAARHGLSEASARWYGKLRRSAPSPNAG